MAPKRIECVQLARVFRPFCESLAVKDGGFEGWEMANAIFRADSFVRLGPCKAIGRRQPGHNKSLHFPYQLLYAPRGKMA